MAYSMEPMLGEVRLVPATDTVPFTGMTGRLSLDISLGDSPEENDLMARMDALTAQVNALTKKSIQSVSPGRATPLSALTSVLLCAGFGVAIVRAGLLFRSDLMC
jgi:hypothetical protein